MALKLEIVENWPKIMEAFEAAQNREYKRFQQALAAVDAYTGRQGGDEQAASSSKETR